MVKVPPFSMNGSLIATMSISMRPEMTPRLFVITILMLELKFQQPHCDQYVPIL